MGILSFNVNSLRRCLGGLRGGGDDAVVFTTRKSTKRNEMSKTRCGYDDIRERFF
jgi:hypothetical protein